MLEAEIRDAHVERYYPDVISPAKEFKNIAQDVNPELVQIWEATWKWMLNTFVYDLDVQGAERWEEMLSLHPGPNDSLEKRRQAILARFNTNRPYTHRSFQAMLNSVYGKDNVCFTLDYDRYHLLLDVMGMILTKAQDVRRYARVIVPANLTIGISHTIKMDMDLNVGAVLSFSKVIAIRPNDDISFEGLSAHGYHAGCVVTRKYKVIGGF